MSVTAALSWPLDGQPDPPPEPPILRAWRPYDPAEFRVRCERRLHRIRVDATGRLVLVDHDMELEILAAALGGDEMRCPAVVGIFKEAVRTGLVGRLPDKAKPHLHALRQRKEDRRAAKSERNTLVWGSTFLADAENAALEVAPATWHIQRGKGPYLARHIRRLLERSRLATAHPHGSPPYPTPHAIQVVLAQVEGFHARSELHVDVHSRQGFGPRTSLRGTLFLHQHWWQRVHRAGLELIDGRLVVDAPSLPEHAGGVLYSFAGMTPRARARARRKARAEPAPLAAQLPLPDIVGETRTAVVCVLDDPLPPAHLSERWQLRLPHRWYAAVAEKGAPWRLERPLGDGEIPRT